MPTVGVKKELLFKALGKKYSDDEFGQLCFAFGLELDEVTSERQMMKKETGAEPGKDASDEILYRIDVPANRYDLLCLEGLARGILIFQGKLKPPQYTTVPETQEKLSITANTQKIRPYCVSAVLRGLTFTQESYNSFIDLQDKLHQNLCRKRSLVAIGTHDLDKLKGPFVYDARPPADIKFVPLNQTQEYTGAGIMELYAHHAQLKQYLPIIRDSPVYPVILDSNGVVLSLPPIINGDHSKISLKTRNVFIECTATDYHKAKIVLDTLVCMFSQYCEKPFHVEQVTIEDSNGKVVKTPEMAVRNLKVNSESVAKIAGVNKSVDEIVELLKRMGLSSLPQNKAGSPKVHILIPPTRHDILHERDIVEDLAIAYGYNSIKKIMPPASTVGKELPLNKLSDFLREEIARCGFTEALTFSLCSIDDISRKLGRKIEDVPAVHVSNPKTLEFQVARTILLPCLLKTIAANKKMPMPLRIFEVSDVVRTDTNSEVGARNKRRIGAVSVGRTAGFEIIHGLLDRIMQVLAVSRNRYSLRAADDPAFFPKRYAEVLVDGSVVGSLGVLHPNVLRDFELTLPCSALELDVEPFL